MCNEQSKDYLVRDFLAKNMRDYDTFCESFFNCYPFNSENNLKDFIEKLTPQEFMVWQQKIVEAYHDEKYSLIIDLIKLIRGKNFDYANDPLKEENYRSLVLQYRKVYEDCYNKSFAMYNCIIAKNKELAEFKIAEAKEKELEIEVEGKHFKATDICDVLWAGWESDDRAWVVMDEGQAKLVASNHGELTFVEPEFLENKIKEYQQVIEDSHRLLAYLKKS